MIEIYCSCAQTPKDEEYLKELGKHLNVFEDRQIARWWHVSLLPAGADREMERDRHLKTASIVLLLVSPDFINSPSCKQEMQLAMKQYEQGKARVIPVLLRHTYFEGVPFEGLQSLPSNSRSINEWKDRDAAYVNVVEGIAAVLKQIHPDESQTLPSASYMSAMSASIQPPVQAWNQSLDRAMFEHFMQFEYRPKLAQFEARSRRYKRNWKRLQWITVGVASTVWLLVLADLLIPNAIPPVQLLLKFLVLIAATLLLVCTLLMANSYAHDRWLNYRQRVDDLKSEEKMYTYQIEAYASNVDRERLFMNRVNTIIEKGEAGTRGSTNTNEYRPSQT